MFVLTFRDWITQDKVHLELGCVAWANQKSSQAKVTSFNPTRLDSLYFFIEQLTIRALLGLPALAVG